MYKIILIVGIILIPIISVFIDHKIGFYAPIVKNIKKVVLNTEDFNGKKEFKNIETKKQIKHINLNNTNTIVIVTFGQSNSANYGEGKYIPKGNVYQYYNGKIYDGSSPMLGATGGGEFSMAISWRKS